MKIQIVVECRFGEESMWVSEISDYEFNILEPLIAEIQRRKREVMGLLILLIIKKNFYLAFLQKLIFLTVVVAIHHLLHQRFLIQRVILIPRMIF